MCRKNEKQDYRAELEKKAKVHYYTMSDGVEVRALEFDLVEQPNDYILLLIPGYVTVFQSWEKVMSLLTPEFRVLYFETREKASSNIPSRKLKRKITFDRMALDLKEYLSLIHISEPTRPY